MASLAEQDITQEQRLYIGEHLAKLKGMIHELIAKKSFLQSRLHGQPKKTDFIQRELNNVEDQMDALLISVEFIENWPGSCIGFCDTCEFDQGCSHKTECPRHNCDCNA